MTVSPPICGSQVLHQPADTRDRREQLVGDRVVEIVLGEVVIHQLRQQRQRCHRMYEIVEEHGFALLGVGFGLAHHRVGHGTDANGGGIAAGVGDAVLLIGVVAARDLDAGVAGEDQFGPARGEFAAASRRPGLDDDRPALRGARHRQRAARGEELADVSQLVHLGRVGELTGHPVVQDGLVLPGVPQAGHHVQELVGAVVPFVVAEVGVDAEVLRLAVVDRRDDVPGRAAARKVVQRGERARHVEGRVVRRRVRRAQPDLRGGLRQHAEDHAEVQLDRPGAVVDRLRPPIRRRHRAWPGGRRRTSGRSNPLRAGGRSWRSSDASR